MPASDVLYTARATAHETLERGRDNALIQAVYDAGALVAPTVSGSSVTVVNAAGVVVVAAAAISVSGSIARYTLPAAVLASEPYGEGWIIAWTLVMPDSTTRTIRRTASLVVSRLLPPATSIDLFGRLRALNPSHASPITALTLADFDDYLDTCWLQIEERLRRKGRRPWLILASEALRELHIVGTIALIFEDLASRNQAAHGERAAYYRELWRVEWAESRFQYLTVDEATGSTSTDQSSGDSTLWLQSFNARRTPDRWGGM